MSASACRCILPSRNVLAVGFSDLVPLLEAGHAASLTPDGGETTHFSVLKTTYDLRVAESFLQPFRGSWQQRFPCHAPTIFRISVSPKAGNTEASSFFTYPGVALCQETIDWM